MISLGGSCVFKSKFLIIGAVLVTCCVNNGVSADLNLEKDTNSLILAVKENQVTEVKKLLLKGIDPNAKDIYGTPLLITAVLNNSSSVVKILLEKGADVNKPAHTGGTAIEIISKRIAGYPNDKAKLLAMLKEVLSRKELKAPDNLISSVAGDGDYDTLEFILKSGIRPISENPKVISPISAAVCKGKGSDKIVSLLIKYGAAVNRPLPDSIDIPIISAAQCEDNSLISLINAKANLEAKTDSFGDTPLLMALKSDQMYNAKLLIESGANVNARDKAGNTPIMLAVESTNEAAKSIIKSLIEKKADLNLRDNNGATVLGRVRSGLKFATGEKDYSVAEALTASGALE